MRTITALTLATAASAQMFMGYNLSMIESEAYGIIASISQPCKTAVIQLATNSSLASCLQVSSLPKLFNSTTSPLPPAFDAYLSEICYSQPCSNATLQSAAMMIESACASDLAQYKIQNNTVSSVFNAYPLAREVACLKTTAPFNGTNATIPVNSTYYNSTNGTFCVTSLMTEISAYLGSNLTANYLLGILAGNQTAVQLLEKIPVTAICNDCIFAALDIIEQSYPILANLTYGPMGLKFGGNGTNIDGFLNATCAAKNYSVNTKGMLPSTVRISAINSTYPYNLTNGQMNFTMGMSKRGMDVTMMKRRWFGEE